MCIFYVNIILQKRKWNSQNITMTKETASNLAKELAEINGRKWNVCNDK